MNNNNNTNDNSKSIGTVHGVKIETGTAAGAAYVNKVTHPPSPMTSEYQGRPDCSAPNVVLMELKGEVNIPPIITVPKTNSTTKTINPSSILFLQSSGAIVSNYVFMLVNDSDTGINGWVQPQGQASSPNTYPSIVAATPPACKLSGYNFEAWPTDVASHRKTYKSSTYYLNATNFNNQGVVVSAKFKPNIVQGITLNELFQQHSNCKRSMENLKNAVQSFNSFEVVDFKNPSTIVNVQFLDFGEAGSGKVNTIPFSPSLYSNQLLPLTASDLLTFSPKAATRPAKDGAFVVQQQEDEIIPWVSSSTTSVAFATLPPGLTLSFMRCVEDGAYKYVPLYSSSTNGLTTSPLTAEVPWSSLDWSMTLFEGLTIPNTVGTTLTSVPYITIKSFLGLEIQPRPNTSLVTFQRTLPLPDDDAIKMAIGIMHARPDSLPAAANDLASIASTAIKFIPTAVEWLKDIFSNKEKKPETSKSKQSKPKKKKDKKPKQKQKKDDLRERIDQLTFLVSNMARDKAQPSKLPSYENTSSIPPRRNKKRVNFVANANAGQYGKFLMTK